MNDLQIIDGAPALLFERLCDFEPKRPADPTPFRVLRPSEIKESIGREIGRLLDTRRAVSIEDFFAETQFTVLEYGIPDYTHLSLPNAERLQFREMIATAIRRFEPRLHDVKVDINVIKERRNALKLIIHGSIIVDSVMEPVSFPLELNLN